MRRVLYSDGSPPPKVVIDDWEPSLTRQSEKDSCDINKIVNTYRQTGRLPQLRQGLYADISQMGDYREALEQVRTADEMFYQLPSDLRLHFDNDPAVFLDFVSDPENIDEMKQLGFELESGDEAPAGDAGPEVPAQEDASQASEDGS